MRRKAVTLTSRAIAFAALGISALSILLYLLFPVEEVRVEGNERLSKPAVLESIPDRASLPTTQARNLEGQLNSNPWVKGIEVSRDWDSGIVVVKVKERDAVLNASLVGGEKVVLAEDGTRLPGLGGASLAEIEVGRMRLEEIREAQEVLEEHGVSVESVEEVGARGVELSVRGPEGAKVRALYSDGIGGGQARVLKGLLRERPEVRYFDLRIPGRVVVGGAPD